MPNAVNGPLTNGWVAFGFGCVAIVVVLLLYLIAFFLPAPPDIRVLEKFLDALQVVLALAAAGVAAVIPGWLSVKFNWPIQRRSLLVIDAGGAMAVFALVFLVDPSSLTKSAIARRLSYNELLANCAEGVRWQGTRQPRSDTLSYCLAAIEYDRMRWEAYRHTAAYYFYFRNYEEVREYYALALRALTNSAALEATFEFKPGLLDATTYIRLLRGVTVGEIGIWLNGGTLDRNRADRSMKVALTVYKDMHLSDRQLWSDLLYGNAMLRHVFWRVEKEYSDRNMGKVRDAWRLLISDGGGILSWVFYHLACLYAEALSVNAITFSVRQELERELPKELERTTDSIINDKENYEQNTTLLQCLLFGAVGCVPEWAGDPLECKPLSSYLMDNLAVANQVRGRLGLQVIQ